MSTRAVLVTGGGGVGKTTVSAGLAVRAAREGHRTLVLTVDPARRLADALGIGTLGADPHPHPDEPNLWAAMLNAERSWRAIVRRHADPEVADRLLANEFFDALASRFPASQAYAAAEEMATLLEARAWDVVVVDTPPASGGIEFFMAPARVRALIGGRLLRWLTGGRLPGRRAMFNLAARPALRIADSILGSDVLERVADFLFDLRTMYDSVSRRAVRIEGHLRRASTLVVTTAEPAPVREAARFFRELPEVARHPSAVVFNRTLPLAWAQAAETEPPPGPYAHLLAENLRRWGEEAHRQADIRAEFRDRYRARVATLPWREHPPTDIDALEELVAASEGIPFEELWA